LTLTDSERRLVQTLRTRQQQLSLLDAAFAAELGISQGYWSLIKRERRRLGRRTAGRILRRFPELWREVQDAMFPRENAA